jgi:two-component system sensor histidine kinase KdpD
VALATAAFHAAHRYLDKGQAAFLYLPVVIGVAVRFGFGPAVLGAFLSFLCWDFFFLPPYHTFIVRYRGDWISLAIFLIAAMTTAQLASQGRLQAQKARAREAEIATLFQASEAVSRELRGAEVLKALTAQLRTLCHTSRCLIYRPGSAAASHLVGDTSTLGGLSAGERAEIERLAAAVAEHGGVVGLGPDRHLWAKAVLQTAQGDKPDDGDVSALGVYVPLHASEGVVGVLHVGPREDGKTYSAVEERLILTLANHAATVIARDALSEAAAEAEALRKADQLKDALLSLVSHELKTPLAAIKASVTALLQPGGVWDAERRTETLHAVDQETDRLTTLVSNLLDLSRLESGSWQPTRDWCDPADLIGTAIDHLRPAAAARVHLTLGPDLPLIRVDHTQISLVLSNLLDNAAKYAGSDCPIDVDVQASYNVHEEGASGVTFVVRDYGPGIAAGEELVIFDRFVRGTQTGDRRPPGTGLGLALSKALVTAHGGNIRAVNAIENGGVAGASFAVTLPVEDVS